MEEAACINETSIETNPRECMKIEIKIILRVPKDSSQ
jgi:hypothetical protein